MWFHVIRIVEHLLEVWKTTKKSKPKKQINQKHAAKHMQLMKQLRRRAIDQRITSPVLQEDLKPAL
jgi:hypothetical protein